MFLTKMFEFCIRRVKNALVAICWSEREVHEKKKKKNWEMQRRVCGGGALTCMRIMPVALSRPSSRYKCISGREV
jgi:hypothetical protein